MVLAVGCPSSWLYGKGRGTSLQRSGSLHSQKHFTPEMLPETFSDNIVAFLLLQEWTPLGFLSDICDILMACQHGASLPRCVKDNGNCLAAQS